MATNNKKRNLGPRCTVLFETGQGKGKGAKSQYVYMLRSVAEKLGFQIVADAKVTVKARGKGRGNTEISVRGSKGSKSIKVLVPGTRTNQGQGAKKRYVNVPVPSNATISKIKKFLSNASKKPQEFVSPNGRTYSLAESKGTKP